MERVAGSGIRIKGKLTLEVDQEVDPQLLATLFQSNQSSQEMPPFLSQPQSGATPPALLSSARTSGQKRSNPNVYPVSGGLMSYSEGGIPN